MIVMRVFAVAAMLAALCCGNAVWAQTPAAPDAQKVLTGTAAFGDWRTNRPGVVRHIRPRDMPAPSAGQSHSNPVRVSARPKGAEPQVPPGFAVALYATLTKPRLMTVAPNGDVFVAESSAGRIAVMRPGKDGKPEKIETFASGLDYPFGIAFYPLGDNPQWVYVGNTNSVVRFAYRNGDMKARGKPQRIVAQLPTGGHATRTLAFSKDGLKLFVSVGSLSNAAEGMQLRARTRWRLASASTASAPPGARRRTGPTCCDSIRRQQQAHLRDRHPQLRRADRAAGTAICGARPTSATASATISCRITHPRAARAASTAGPGTTSATTRIRATRASGRISRAKSRVPDVLIRRIRPRCR